MSESREIIAVDIGATYVRVSFFSKNILLKIKKSETPREGNSGDVISQKIIEMIYSNLSKEEINLAVSIGVSSAGPLNIQKGEILNSPNMYFSQIEIKKPLENEFHKEVKMLNDCHAGVLGEISTDSSLKDKNIVYITISSGIGAGAFINGKLIQGDCGNAGELGHIFVDSEYYLPCKCGGFGHWESYCSGTGMPVFFREFSQRNKYDLQAEEELNSQKIFLNAKLKKKYYCDFVEELGKINSRGISCVIAAYSPEIIILDGSVAINNMDEILKGIYKYTDRHLKMPEIKASKLSGLAPLYGAAYYSGYL